MELTIKQSANPEADHQEEVDMASTRLEYLPVEIKQQIAVYLDDKSVCAFRATCKRMKNGLDGHHETFWREYFNKNFDRRVTEKTMIGMDFKKEYQNRKEVLHSHGGKFKTGYYKRERSVAQVIVDLAIDAKPKLDDNDVPQSRNFDFLRKFCIKNPNFLGCIFKATSKAGSKAEFPSILLMAQVVIAPLLLNPTIPQDVLGFIDSQAMAYAGPLQESLLKGRGKLKVNLEWILHVINFFRFHMLRADEHTLYDPYVSLDPTQRPSMWREQISDKPEILLGKVWTGTYAYLDVDEVQELRVRLRNPGQSNANKRSKERILLDRNVDMGPRALQSVKFYRSEEQEIEWPSLFERYLNSHWFSALQNPTHSQSRNKPPPPRSYFEGVGFDDEKFFTAGFTYPLPPQNNVPGFHRVVMMKYFKDEDGSFENEALWAYEGVILPGGSIMVGRWWAPRTLPNFDNVYSGPFIFWNVDAAIPDEERGPDSEYGFDVTAAHQKKAILNAMMDNQDGFDEAMDLLNTQQTTTSSASASNTAGSSPPSGNSSSSSNDANHVIYDPVLGIDVVTSSSNTASNSKNDTGAVARPSLVQDMTEADLWALGQSFKFPNVGNGVVNPVNNEADDTVETDDSLAPVTITATTTTIPSEGDHAYGAPFVTSSGTPSVTTSFDKFVDGATNAKTEISAVDEIEEAEFPSILLINHIHDGQVS